MKLSGQVLQARKTSFPHWGMSLRHLSERKHVRKRRLIRTKRFGSRLRKMTFDWRAMRCQFWRDRATNRARWMSSLGRCPGEPQLAFISHRLRSSLLNHKSSSLNSSVAHSWLPMPQLPHQPRPAWPGSKYTQLVQQCRRKAINGSLYCDGPNTMTLCSLSCREAF